MTDSEHGDAAAADAFKSLDIRLYRFRQFLKGAAGSDILGKAVKFLIDGGAVREFGKVCGEFLDSFALVCIGNANLELRQTAQRVDLIDDHFGQTIDADGVARNDSVKPAGTARATGIGAEFTAGIADVVAGFVKQFSRERPLPTRVV